MAKSKTLIAAEERIAALEARIVVATQVYKNQQARIAELEAKLATRGVIAPAPKAAPVTKTWHWTDRYGVEWISTRTGNQTRSRPVAH